MDSLIRWKKGDYIRLGRAISKFNKTVENIEVDERDVLPELQNYKELKSSINSRKELNRVIKALNRANEKNLTEKRTYESGEQLTKWEYNEVNKAMRRAMRNLESERASILSGRESIGMGEERLSEIKAIERSFESLGERVGREFDRVKTRIFSLGKSDYKLTKDIQFQQNFYKALEGISNFQNYDVLKHELDKIKNPTKFYEYVKKSPVLMDLFLWYKESDSLFYGGFSDNEDAFDSTLMYHLGITDIDTL